MKQAKQSALGFTLIELMIVVAIVAIIVAIALPAYTTHVTRTNRAEAQQMLSETAQALERCFTRFGSYTAAQCEVGFPIDGDNYVMAADEQDVDATEFVLTATPIGAQASRDAGKCDSLTLTHRGVRDRTGTSDRCWP